MYTGPFSAYSSVGVESYPQAPRSCRWGDKEIKAGRVRCLNLTKIAHCNWHCCKHTEFLVGSCQTWQIVRQ